jgi:hypothetical protein
MVYWSPDRTLDVEYNATQVKRKESGFISIINSSVDYRELASDSNYGSC